jgi:hypothetical protein
MGKQGCATDRSLFILQHKSYAFALVCGPKDASLLASKTGAIRFLVATRRGMVIAHERTKKVPSKGFERRCPYLGIASAIRAVGK